MQSITFWLSVWGFKGENYGKRRWTQLHTGGKDKGEQKVSFNLKLMATKTQGAWKNESRTKTKVATQQQNKVAK